MTNATKISRLDLEPDVEMIERQPHKPTLGIYIDVEDGQTNVVLQIGSLWGQQLRWVEMTAEQALVLAYLLTSHADKIQSARKTMSNDELVELINSPAREVDLS